VPSVMYTATYNGAGISCYWFIHSDVVTLSTRSGSSTVVTPTGYGSGSSPVTAYCITIGQILNAYVNVVVVPPTTSTGVYDDVVPPTPTSPNNL